MSGWVYILQCSDDSYYTGSTNNLEIRISQHQNGEGANYTKKRLPVKLMFSQEYDRVDEAFYVEKQVQGWSRKKKQALIDGKFEMLHELSKCLNETHFSNKPTSPFDSAQGPVTSKPSLSNSDAAKIEIHNGLNKNNSSSSSEERRSSQRGETRRSSLSGVEGHGQNGKNSNNKEAK